MTEDIGYERCVTREPKSPRDIQAGRPYSRVEGGRRGRAQHERGWGRQPSRVRTRCPGRQLELAADRAAFKIGFFGSIGALIAGLIVSTIFWIVALIIFGEPHRLSAVYRSASANSLAN